MSLASGCVAGGTVGAAWLAAIDALVAAPGHKLTHLVVRIADPVAEDPQVRAAADALLAERGKQPVDTVANTIFPAAWAATRPEPAELAGHYRDMMPVLRRFPKNNKGLYFGRIVDYPNTPADRADQLTNTVRKLRQERASTGGAKSSRYEIAISAPSVDIPIYTPGPDANKTMDFPCLSFVSFHLDGGVLHLSAQYRNQQLIERGYGNYLGLGRLLHYVAAAVDVDAGELLVVAGHAELDCGLRRAQQLLDDCRTSVTGAEE